MKKIILLIATLLISVNVKAYTITLNSDALEQNVYQTENKTLYITMKVKEGYQYVSNDCAAQVSDKTIIISQIDSDKTCNLTFEKIKYNVTFTATIGGTIEESKKQVQYGESADFKIVPDEDYLYKSNTCGAINNNNVLTLSNIKDNYICTVAFEHKPTYHLGIDVIGEGTVTPKNTDITQNKTIKIYISPKTGYYLESSTCGLPVDNYLTLTMTNDITCTVKFTKKSYDEVVVKAHAQKYGTVEPTKKEIEKGTSAVFNLYPEEGYRYQSNDCGAKLKGSSLVLEHVEKDTSCIITFVEKIESDKKIVIIIDNIEYEMKYGQILNDLSNLESIKKENFLMFIDESGNEVPEETIITKNLVLKSIYNNPLEKTNDKITIYVIVIVVEIMVAYYLINKFINKRNK